MAISSGSAGPLVGPYIIPNHVVYPDGYDDTASRIQSVMSRYRMSKKQATQLVVAHDQKTRGLSFPVTTGFGPVNTTVGDAAAASAAATAAAQDAHRQDQIATSQKIDAVDNAPSSVDAKKYGYSNPPFDPRITNLSPVGNPGRRLQRGWIEQSPNAWTKNSLGGQSQPFRCNFLYNPAAITVNYSASNVYPQDAQQAAGGGDTTLLASNMQTIGFDLYFDRTFEVLDIARVPYSAQASKLMGMGVYGDVAALERCCGLFNGNGPLLPLPLNLYFAAVVEADADQPLPVTRKNYVRPLRYYGYVQSMTVGYSHFSYDMVPMRCGVSLQFSQIVTDSQGKLLDKGKDSGFQLDTASPDPAAAAAATP